MRLSNPPLGTTTAGTPFIHAPRNMFVADTRMLRPDAEYFKIASFRETRRSPGNGGDGEKRVSTGRCEFTRIQSARTHITAVLRRCKAQRHYTHFSNVSDRTILVSRRCLVAPRKKNPDSVLLHGIFFATFAHSSSRCRPALCFLFNCSFFTVFPIIVSCRFLLRVARRSCFSATTYGPFSFPSPKSRQMGHTLLMSGYACDHESATRGLAPVRTRRGTAVNRGGTTCNVKKPQQQLHYCM